MTFEISQEIQHEIDQWLKKYPVDQRKSALIPALLLVQEQNGGWLSDLAMDAVAEYIGVTKIEVYEVATFYDMYNLQPIGKYKISVCTNVSCQLMGAEQIMECIQGRLNILPGATTSDGKFTLHEVECMAACGGAPMCQINDREYYENLTPAKMETLLDKLEQGIL